MQSGNGNVHAEKTQHSTYIQHNAQGLHLVKAEFRILELSCTNYQITQGGIIIGGSTIVLVVV